MSYALLAESFPKARKRHDCIWCGEHILVGEKYRDERSVYAGNIQRFRWHLECDEAGKEEAWESGGSFEFLPYSSERPQKDQT